MSKIMKVYLVTKPTMNYMELGEFFEDEDLNDRTSLVAKEEPTRIMEAAARLCYMSYGKGRKDPKEFVENILSSGHGSVLEHVNYGFIITGVSRALTHELVRHRHLSFSQLSQRFVKDMPEFVAPAGLLWDNNEERADIADKLIEELGGDLRRNNMFDYEWLQEALDKNFTDWTRKQRQEVARLILPSIVETKIFVTGNVRSWRHFLSVRGSKHADREIRSLAVSIASKLQSEGGLLFMDMEIIGGEVKFKYAT